MNKKDIIVDGQSEIQQQIEEAVDQQLYSSSTSESVSYPMPGCLLFEPAEDIHINQVYIAGADSRYLGNSIGLIMWHIQGVQYVRVSGMGYGLVLTGQTGIQTPQTILLTNSNYPSITGYAIWDGILNADAEGEWSALYWAYTACPSSSLSSSLSESSVSTQWCSTSSTGIMTSSQSTGNSGPAGSLSVELSSATSSASSDSDSSMSESPANATSSSTNT